MSKEYKLFYSILKSFHRNHLLNHIILIGSWAQFLYKTVYFKDKYLFSLRTTDIDWLIQNPPGIPGRINVTSILEEHGFVKQADTLTGIEQFHHPELNIQFLTSEKGSGRSETYSIEALGLRVEGLRFMEMLIDSAKELEIPGMEGLRVKVPSPQAFVLQKILIIPRRKPEKQEKDILAVKGLLKTLFANPMEKEHLKELYDSLPKNWIKRIHSICKKHDITIEFSRC